jgi:hypothetical protein
MGGPASHAAPSGRTRGECRVAALVLDRPRQALCILAAVPSWGRPTGLGDPVRVQREYAQRQLLHRRLTSPVEDQAGKLGHHGVAGEQR